jgi:hypothetical protein
VFDGVLFLLIFLFAAKSRPSLRLTQRDIERVLRVYPPVYAVGVLN